MVSINGMLEGAKPKHKEEEIEDFSDRPRTIFSEEEFKEQWSLYIKKLKKEKRASLMSTLSSLSLIHI